MQVVQRSVKDNTHLESNFARTWLKRMDTLGHSGMGRGAFCPGMKGDNTNMEGGD